MLGRLGDWLFDGGGPENIPDRVRDAIRRQQERSEILIGWIQLVIVGLVTGLYQSTSMAEGLVQDEYSVELQVLFIYAAFCVVRIGLAHARLLKPWMLYISVIADVALLTSISQFR